jgi:hypothetical protein
MRATARNRVAWWVAVTPAKLAHIVDRQLLRLCTGSNLDIPADAAMTVDGCKKNTRWRAYDDTGAEWQGGTALARRPRGAPECYG